ncbi:hypothetical protein MAR_013518 [Mya arenaria]|uniref:SET domain-containing protein n=1 Tax=Mya arenaria TaxID=6604 RepID=A0ABY7G3G0_MYAAR|nr:hypothetical protein MAR_013518 [Mya arenaria]
MADTEYIPSVDGTYAHCVGRIINDEHKKTNCKVRLEEMKGKDVIAVYTIKDITKGSELRFDYGDKQEYWGKKNDKKPVLYPEPTVFANPDVHKGTCMGSKLPDLEPDSVPESMDSSAVLANPDVHEGTCIESRMTDLEPDSVPKSIDSSDELSDDEGDQSEDEADVYDFAEPNDDDSI